MGQPLRNATSLASRPGAAAGPAEAAAEPAAAVAELRTLQAEYEAWRDQLPESLADSRTAELLEGVCDLEALDVELPRGRDSGAVVSPRPRLARRGGQEG